MRGDEKMPDQLLEILKNINQNLEDIKKEEKLPKLIYAKEIAEKYKGSLTVSAKDGWFELRILIPIPESMDEI